MRTCGSCGARLTDGAAWCSLCFAPVADDDESVAVEVEPETASPAAPHAGTSPAATAPTDPARWSDTGRRIGDHALLVAGDARGWRCELCATEHPIEVTRCDVCGTSLFSAAQRDDDRRDVPVRTAALWSLVPGGGQWVVGLHLQAPARFATIVLALAASFTFPTQGLFLFGRVLFVVIGVALWVVSGRDACAVAAGRSPLLTDRRLLWTSAGLLGLLVVTAMVGVVIGVTAGV